MFGSRLDDSHDLIRVGELADVMRDSFVCDRDYEHFGAAMIDTIEVKLERSMQQHVPRADTMSAGIPSLDIAAAQDDSGESRLMDVAGQKLAGRMPEMAARCRSHPSGR